ncbi:hypothetical protein KBA63_04375, partial [Candidatus Woesebacteria bacterium]|nr:hypothetical protein [Candidatus Woesebacteria bacterium]
MAAKKKVTKKTAQDESKIIRFTANKKHFELLHPFRLDIACGQNKTPGFFGVDIAPGEGVDVVWDLEQFPWPFPDNSVDEAVCNHYI